MKKILPLLLVGILVLSGLGAVGTYSETESENDCGCDNFEADSNNFGDGGVSAGLSSEDIAALQQQGKIEGWTFTVGENSATSRSLNKLCGLKVPENWWVGASFDPCTKGSLPPTFDWRELGGCTEIKDQGNCGSCWAFGTVGPLECNILIKDGIEKDLSEQWLVSCNRDGWGCGGGWWAHDYHMWKTDSCGDTGAVLEQYFPYVASNAPCDCPYPHDYLITDWAFIGSEQGVPSVDAIKQAIYDYGPVSATVCVNPAFQAYTGGIFNGPSCDEINHAVVLVGWDDNQGSNGVWFLRNSWGTGWGEDGYMRIEYGTSKIGYAACYVDYKRASGDVGLTVSIQKLTNDPSLGDFDPIDSWVWPNTEEPEWYYRVGVKSGSETLYQHAYNKDPNSWWFPWISEHTWDAKRDHPFNVGNSNVEVTIKLMDHDGISEGGFDDLADVSAYAGGGEDNQISDKRAAMYYGTYDLITNKLTGDYVTDDGGYKVTEGAYAENANNARVWFKITDDYEPPMVDLIVEGSLQGSTNKGTKNYYLGSFEVSNVGIDPQGWSKSYLDWEVASYPTNWGNNWRFEPKQGDDLPSGESKTVKVYVDVPNEKNTFTGAIKVWNRNNHNDYGIVDITLTASMNQESSQQQSSQQSTSPLFLQILGKLK